MAKQIKPCKYDGDESMSMDWIGTQAWQIGRMKACFLCTTWWWRRRLRCFLASRLLEIWMLFSREQFWKKNCSALEAEALTFRNHWRKSEPHRTSWCRMKCAWNECNALQGKNKTWQIWWILPSLLPSVLILRVEPASGKIAKMWTRKYGQISGHSNIHKLVHPQHQKLQDFFGKWRCVVISYSFRIFCQACDLKRNIGIQAKLSCSFFSLREKYWLLWGGCWGSVCPTFVSSC